MTVYYAKLLTAPEGGYTVEFPSLPGAATQGESKEEALEMAVDCLRTHLRGLITANADLPAAHRPAHGRLIPIALPALETAKVELYRIFRASGLKKAHMAARLGIPRTHVDRLFNLDHASRLNQIEAAFRVLGKTLVVKARDAA